MFAYTAVFFSFGLPQNKETKKSRRDTAEENGERIVISQDLKIEDEISIEDEAFQGFVGNEVAITKLKRLIRYARMRSISLPNLGLFGPRSTGKTELCRRIARAMGLPVLTLSKSTLNSEESFFKEVTKELSNNSDGMLCPDSMIVFIDEVHVLSQRIQDSLLTALERDDRCFRSKHGDIDTRNITFIMATTEPGKLSQPFLRVLFLIF